MCTSLTDQKNHSVGTWSIAVAASDMSGIVMGRILPSSCTPVLTLPPSSMSSKFVAKNWETILGTSAVCRQRMAVLQAVALCQNVLRLLY